MAISDNVALPMESNGEFDVRGIKAVQVVLNGVSPETVSRWEKNQGLPLYRLNTRIYAKRHELVAWMNSAMS